MYTELYSTHFFLSDFTCAEKSITQNAHMSSGPMQVKIYIIDVSYKHYAHLTMTVH
jgi:hypothetical protein